MNRRSLLKYTAYITGYAAVAPLSSAILSGCKAEAPTTGFTPAFFTTDEYQHLVAMVNTMLPPTATPGAVELGVPEFIDLLLSVYSEDDDRDKIRVGLSAWSTKVNKETGKPYYELSAEEQLSILNQLDATSRQQEEQLDQKEQQEIREEKAGNNSDDPFSDDDDDSPWWLTLKSIAIGGYYSSEKIGTEVLAYDPVPGPYQGCIPLDEVGKAWSLN